MIDPHAFFASFSDIYSCLYLNPSLEARARDVDDEYGDWVEYVDGGTYYRLRCRICDATVAHWTASALPSLHSIVSYVEHGLNHLDEMRGVSDDMPE